MVELLAGERVDRFISEDLKIIQSPEVFSFSMDAVLLANFTRVPRRDDKRIVDFCTGNGAVALMLSAKTKSEVIGIELQERLADMAKRSVTLNELNHQVNIVCDDVNNVRNWLERESVDVITCNPPYFKSTATDKVNINDHYALARHEISFDIHQAIKEAQFLLTNKGKFYCVHRPDRLLEIISSMQAHQLVPKRIQFVHGKADREANMVLIEAIRNGKKTGLRIAPPIIAHNEDSTYTDEMKAILFGS